MACRFLAGMPFGAPSAWPKAFAPEVEHTDTSDRPYQEKLFDVAVDFTYSEAGDYMLAADAETLDDLC